MKSCCMRKHSLPSLWENYVHLTYSRPNGQTKEMTYIVSGFYHCDVDRPISAMVLYEENSVQELVIATQVMIRFHSSFGIDRRLEAVTERLGEWKHNRIIVLHTVPRVGSFREPVINIIVLKRLYQMSHPFPGLHPVVCTVEQEAGAGILIHKSKSGNRLHEFYIFS